MINSHHHPDSIPAAASWDERYRSASQLWSGNPNMHLISQTADLKRGTALDVGCGEGADAIWLAEQGWQVTAVDFSVVALERGAAQARTLGAEVAGRITWLPVDLTDWAPPAASFELVSCQFMHLPSDQRLPLFRRLAKAVAAGSTLLIVGHHPSDLQTTIRRPPIPDLLYTGSDLAALLDANAWDVIVSEAPGREVTDSENRPVTVHDTVFRARRRP